MSTTMASTDLPRRRRSGQASSLVQVVRWATRRILLRLRLRSDHEVADSRRRDIAQARRRAAQVRRSHPGYADDLEAAAAALEARIEQL